MAGFFYVLQVGLMRVAWVDFLNGADNVMATGDKEGKKISGFCWKKMVVEMALEMEKMG